MGLIDRLIEPMKDYISFRDFIFHLSSVNDEPLYEVVTYLLHYDLGAIDFYNIDTDYKIIRFAPGEFDTVIEFLKEIQKALSFSSEKWVWSSPTSLEELRDQDRRALTDTISKAMHCFFKKADILSFEPLNGLMRFEGIDAKDTVKVENIEDLIESEFEKQHREYIAVNDFVNNLHRGIGSGKPLKFTLNSLLKNTSLREVKLYRFQNLNYSLVSQNDNLKYKNTDELLGCFYDVLNNEQTGTVSSDREPFKDFYFKYSEVENLGASGSTVVEKEQPVYIDKQSSISDQKLLEGRSIINSLGENQRLLITYPSFVEEEIACLIIDENPACISHNDNYLRHSRMISKAISGGLLIPDDEGQILAEQVKIWLASHNFIYKGFNDGTPTIDQLLKENTKLRANTKLKASQPQQNDGIREQTIEKLKKMAADYEELSLKYESINTQNKELLDKIEQYKQDNSEVLTQHWAAESKKYKSKIEELEAVIKEFSDVEILSQDGDWQLYNWKEMDGNQYPPELHLAIEVWKRYYKAGDIEDITQFNTGKFNRITGELNLNDSGNLKGRIRTILTPLKSKKTAAELLAALRGIDIIYNDKMAD